VTLDGLSQGARAELRVKAFPDQEIECRRGNLQVESLGAQPRDLGAQV
jgi:hypothetical protein